MTDVKQIINQTLTVALDIATAESCPPRLAEAVRYAVLPGGARVRPELCLAVAGACGSKDLTIPLAAAAAIELMHCASLVHDDLPCFDNAPIRRGKPSVHAAYGERLAVLAGDALIVMSFEVLLREINTSPQNVAECMRIVGQGVGMPAGISAGQAWECEPKIPLREYHQAKTGALFAAASMCGAAASGEDPSDWRELGQRLGEAYQVADDLQDVAGNPEKLGKPINQDDRLGRPSAVENLGIIGATEKLQHLISLAAESIPDCPGAPELRQRIKLEAKRFIPESLAKHVA